ncbi:MAG: molecular chaperone DnaJ, partial [Alphaproteobacteria bacterium]|nr:molecular chaperone DnaJ [Alphaproteobacteria bacterium]
MLAYAIGGLTILIGLVLLARWFVSAEPKDILRAARRAALIVGVLFVVYMAVAGRWQLLPALLFLALPWFNRMNLLRTMAKNKAGPTPGQTSDVETGYLRMTLDHDTGNMSGEVLAGSFAGARVEELALADLIRLRDECARADEPSVVVLESY